MFYCRCTQEKFPPPHPTPPPNMCIMVTHYINTFSSCVLLDGGATSMFHVHEVSIIAISFVSQQI